jgi:hypothetical protein
MAGRWSEIHQPMHQLFCLQALFYLPASTAVQGDALSGRDPTRFWRIPIAAGLSVWIVVRCFCVLDGQSLWLA